MNQGNQNPPGPDQLKEALSQLREDVSQSEVGGKSISNVSPIIAVKKQHIVDGDYLYVPMTGFGVIGKLEHIGNARWSLTDLIGVVTLPRMVPMSPSIQGADGAMPARLQVDFGAFPMELFDRLEIYEDDTHARVPAEVVATFKKQLGGL